MSPFEVFLKNVVRCYNLLMYSVFRLFSLSLCCLCCLSVGPAVADGRVSVWQRCKRVSIPTGILSQGAWQMIMKSKGDPDVTTGKSDIWPLTFDLLQYQSLSWNLFTVCCWQKFANLLFFHLKTSELSQSNTQCETFQDECQDAIDILVSSQCLKCSMLSKHQQLF